MATKFSLESKFVSGGSKLKVYAHEGKTGINLGVTIKNPGMKAITGCQETVEVEKVEEATSRFHARVAEALEQGWVPRTSTSGIATRRASFSMVPVAPGAPVAAPTAEEVVGGDVVDGDGFVVDPKESVLETVPAEQPAAPIVKEKGKRNGRK